MEEAKEKEAQERKDRNYSRALEKAAEETKILFEDEQEDASLTKSLQKARELSAKKKLEEALLAQRLEAKAQRKEVKIEDMKPEVLFYKGNNESTEDTSLLFDETTQFMRAVQPLFEDKPKKKKIEDKKAMQAVNEEIDNDRAEHEAMLKKQAEKVLSCLPFHS